MLEEKPQAVPSKAAKGPVKPGRPKEKKPEPMNLEQHAEPVFDENNRNV